MSRILPRRQAFIPRGKILMRYLRTELVEELLALNQQQSELYTQPGQVDLRNNYRVRHPTRIACFKCMDGRVNLSALTGTPIGVIRPYRNIGGVFDLGWPALEERLNDYVDYTIDAGAQNLFLATYHYSKSSKQLGCRGHNYDVSISVDSARTLVEQMNRVFGKGHEQVYPLVVGVETDGEELIFHGRDGIEERMGDHLKEEPRHLNSLIRELYPDMPQAVVKDLLPLMSGNAEHIKKIRREPKKVEQLDHTERILAVGEGFDWLHRVNYALIINDLDPTLDDTIAKAAGIVKENRDKKRIPSDQALYFVSVWYFQQGRRRANAVERAHYLTALGLESIRKFHHDLDGFFQPLTAVMDWETRKLELLETR